MTNRYPGYNVLSKRDGMSWNDATRTVIETRLAIVNEPKFFNAGEWRTLCALCARILPQPDDRPTIPLAAYIDRNMLANGASGTRIAPMPYDGEAWRRALVALDAEALRAYGAPFAALSEQNADALLRLMQSGDLHDPAWGVVPPKLFFAKRVLVDIPAVYYAHPTAWSEIGFGGPASPRGYVRMAANRRDPWEAAEAKPERPSEHILRDNQRVR
ncbi:MAG TPA: gluconate 2-dehydrogenase subunit 3 family protein [Acidocella sp.]|nr:gluconate 2-dehydrogenase subunit 3 family protein [Acidocella sp.]